MLAHTEKDKKIKEIVKAKIVEKKNKIEAQAQNLNIKTSSSTTTTSTITREINRTNNMENAGSWPKEGL